MRDLELNLFIEHAREGEYFTLPFQIPQSIESLTLTYRYQRYDGLANELPRGTFTSENEINIIDLGLIAPDGTQIGASGSDKTEIFLSETSASPGYTPVPLVCGEWSILVGAYKIAPEGVSVSYRISYNQKHLRLYQGDLHTHTLDSDGVHTKDEIIDKAMRNGLDFVAITDHNHMESSGGGSQTPGVTLIPGIEWTHYKGHANFLGVNKPYEQPFVTHTLEETQAIFTSAYQRGALITINHPFESGCEFNFDISTLPFHCLEVWNGPMRESNLRAVGLWQHLLVSGKKIPICGGSDYHRDTLFIFLGGPTTCVFALSRSVSDILESLKAGHAYVKFAPNGPSLELHSQSSMMGDSVAWSKDSSIEINAKGLIKGDILQLITQDSSSPILEAPSNGSVTLSLPVENPGFVRVEILRAFLPGLPLLPALISNPIYFDQS
ncbi:MAG: CehA/McbA family metallohydrolase [Anaerolineaceae bacterium]|nr:CehA/McbA family metallohydrolase [Anaerolineaceae bacterium]